MINTLDIDRQERTTRAISFTGTILFHALMFILLSILTLKTPKPAELIELEWGSSTGAPNQSIVEPRVETEKQRPTQPKPVTKAAEKKKVDLPRMKSTSEETIPVKPKPKPGRVETKQKTGEAKTPAKITKAERSEPAGAGKSTGYSIEWSGVGSRRLLSGRMPRYPEGTDKEMPVLLQFTVLPDGSVTGVIPLKRSDELLEREAISALRTWRFDALDPRYEQVPQNGKITFNFVLEGP
jgi:TonB family protein